MDIANIISVLRVLTLPLIIYLITLSDKAMSFWALVILFVAVFSDILDSYLAKKRGKTKVGSFLDPFADKILLAGLFLFFVLEGEFSVIVLILFILRDIIATVIMWLSSRDNLVIKGRKFYDTALQSSQFLILFSLVLKDLFQYDLIRSVERMSFAGDMILFFTVIALFLVIASVINAFLYYVTGLRKRKKRGAKIRKEDIVVLANRRSRGYHDGYRKRLLELFAKRRNARMIYLPHKDNMYEGVEDEIGDVKQVVIAGGDGSFEGALNYKPFNKMALGFFPMGAGNAFYSYFYKGKRFKYLRSRFPFRSVKLDVLEVESEQGKIETMIFNLGIDADMIKLSSTRTKHGLFDYVKGSAKALAKAKASYKICSKIDGKKRCYDNCAAICFGKVPYAGFSLRVLLGDVKPDDGNVYGAFCVNTHAPIFNKLVRLLGFVLGIFNVDKPPLFPFKGGEVLIESDIPFPMQAGGEYIGMSKWVKVRVKRKQKVLMI